MQVVRKTQTADTQQLAIKIPKSFVHKKLEIIIMPVESNRVEQPGTGWPKNFFAKTAGCFAEMPLVREEQGVYEKREEMA